MIGSQHFGNKDAPPEKRQHHYQIKLLKKQREEPKSFVHYIFIEI